MLCGKLRSFPHSVSHSEMQALVCAGDQVENLCWFQGISRAARSFSCVFYQLLWWKRAVRALCSEKP